MPTLQSAPPPQSQPLDESQRQDGDAPCVAPPSRDMEFVLRLIEAMQQGSNRSKAAQRMIGLLAQMLPEQRIMLAFGTTNRCQQVIDSRLGPLAKESLSSREIQEAWSAESLKLQNTDTWQLALPGQQDQIAWLLIDNEPPFSESLKQILQRSADCLGGVLWSRRAWAPAVGEVWRNKANRHKIMLSAAALIGLLLLPLQYRVPCNAVVTPMTQRIVAAPFDAQLQSSDIRPGDRVRAGDTLGQLDGRPLRIQREALRADLQQSIKSADVAMAAGRIADAQLARLETESLRAELALIEDRLESLTIRCPIDGVIVSGDLRKAQGMPLATGDSMFEVAPLDKMTFEVEVPEIDVQYVQPGSQATVRIAALGRSVSGNLQRVYPQSQLRDDQNVFIGVWETDNAAGDLRPGMEGTAVIYGPKRPLSWRWLRRSYEGTLKAIGW